jgi:hypothetical protein
VRKLLGMAAVLDPRFKNMVWISDEQEVVFNTLMTEMSQELDKVKVKTEFDTEIIESVAQSPESVQSENPNADVNDVKDENLNLVKKPKLDASDDDFFDVLFIKEEKSSE